jgi:hypothetical protein
MSNGVRIMQATRSNLSFGGAECITFGVVETEVYQRIGLFNQRRVGELFELITTYTIVRVRGEYGLTIAFTPQRTYTDALPRLVHNTIQILQLFQMGR